MAFVKLNKLKSSGKAAAKKSAEHPLLKVDGVNENVKQMYLQGVVLGSLLDDGEITEKERAYVTTLGASLGIEAADVASCVETVQQLGSDEDKEEFVKELLALMQPEAIALLFIADFEGIIDLNETLSEELVDYLNYFGDGLFHREEWRDYVWDHEKIVDAQRVFARNLKAAEAGDAFAQAVVGQGYYNGQGVAKDFSQAAQWFKKSAGGESWLGYVWFAGCNRDGVGMEKNIETAVHYFELGAAKGAIGGFTGLGALYRDGNGVVQDYRHAHELFLKAAEKGSAYAQVEVGLMYFRGTGCIRDHKIAAEWFLKAAEQGYAPGQNWIGWRYHNGEGVERDLDRAFQWQMKAAEQGDKYGEEAVALAYRNGEGIAKSDKAAFQWFFKAATHGLASSQNWIGWCYGTGTGVLLDNSESYKWYRRAAEQGLAIAEWNCSYCYENGIGIDRNENESFAWALKAAEHGNVQAMVKVWKRFIRGQSSVTGNIDRDFEVGRTWLKKAAAEGDAESAYEWGSEILCDSKLGTKQDSCFWLQKAATQGHEKAKWCLEHNFNLRS